MQVDLGMYLHTYKTTFFLALLHPENEGSITLQNIRNYNPSDIE
jgi:hypothetical protein